MNSIQLTLHIFEIHHFVLKFHLVVEIFANDHKCQYFMINLCRPCNISAVLIHTWTLSDRKRTLHFQSLTYIYMYYINVCAAC